RVAGERPAQVDLVNSKVQERAAAGYGALGHPLDALLAVAVDHAAYELERDVLDLLAGGELAAGGHERGITHPQGNGGEHAGCCGCIRDGARFGRVQRARLFDRERDAPLDQETRLLGHAAVPSERKCEIGLQPLAHLAIVGEEWTASLFAP